MQIFSYTSAAPYAADSLTSDIRIYNVPVSILLLSSAIIANDCSVLCTFINSCGVTVVLLLFPQECTSPVADGPL